MIRIIYNRDKCIGCNSCSDIYPERWSINEQDGKSDLREAVKKSTNFYFLETANEEEDFFNSTFENCPVNCIEVCSH